MNIVRSLCNVVKVATLLTLTAAGDILDDADAGATIITGSDITLAAGGGIGGNGNAAIDIDLRGQLSVTTAGTDSAGDVDINQAIGALNLDLVTVDADGKRLRLPLIRFFAHAAEESRLEIRPDESA